VCLNSNCVGDFDGKNVSRSDGRRDGCAVGVLVDGNGVGAVDGSDVKGAVDGPGVEGVVEGADTVGCVDGPGVKGAVEGADPVGGAVEGTENDGAVDGEAGAVAKSTETGGVDSPNSSLPKHSTSWWPVSLLLIAHVCFHPALTVS